MANEEWNMADDPIRKLVEKRRRKRILSVALPVATVLLAVAALLLWPRKGEPEDVPGVFESISMSTSVIGALGTPAAGDQPPYAERLDTVVSACPLTLYIPHGGAPRLYVGKLDDDAFAGWMAFQAADIRADNWEILGEFVLSGEQLAEGVSKKGYCAIIDGKVTVGVGESTPLLSESIDRGGYFFRQYALVDGGVPVENKPLNRTIRKALCDRGGQIFVAVSAGDITYSDFARVLADLEVTEAISLIGGKGAFGWVVDADGTREQFASEDLRPEYGKQSYIVWK